MSTIREPAVEGLFYPSSLEETNSLIRYFEQNITNIDNKLAANLRILISPHAGIIYSGQTASFGFSLLKEKKFKRIICFAPSHRIAFKGISVGNYDFYKFCNQLIPIDKDYIATLTKQFKKINFLEKAHIGEHASELQLPFLNYFTSNYKYVSFVYSEYNPKDMAKIMEFILSDKDNLIIVSSDLSHFKSYSTANEIDSNTISFISTKDLNSLENNEACGIQGIIAAVIVSQKLNYNTNLLDYRNSGDMEIDADKERVVGYASIALTSSNK